MHNPLPYFNYVTALASFALSPSAGGKLAHSPCPPTTGLRVHRSCTPRVYSCAADLLVGSGEREKEVVVNKLWHSSPHPCQQASPAPTTPAKDHKCPRKWLAVIPLQMLCPGPHPSFQSYWQEAFLLIKLMNT